MVFCTEQGCEKTVMIGDGGLKKATSQANLGHFQPPSELTPDVLAWRTSFRASLSEGESLSEVEIKLRSNLSARKDVVGG
jgi:hypothetical protein